MWVLMEIPAAASISCLTREPVSLSAPGPRRPGRGRPGPTDCEEVCPWSCPACPCPGLLPASPTLQAGEERSHPWQWPFLRGSRCLHHRPCPASSPVALSGPHWERSQFWSRSGFLGPISDPTSPPACMPPLKVGGTR